MTRQERRDAELDYVKKFAQQWSSALNREVFLAEHPRYAELVQRKFNNTLYIDHKFDTGSSSSNP